jgi:hypothetical protein
MNMAKLRKMLIPMENAMTAAAFAEEGDVSTATTLMQDSRRVLLALRDGQADAKTLMYALNAAKRIHARLDILTVTPSNAERSAESGHSLDPYLSELTEAGISYRVIHRSGCLKEQIVEHTNREKDILFAVIESPAQLDADCTKRDRVLAELWRTLKCPLVVVMEGAS